MISISSIINGQCIANFDFTSTVGITRDASGSFCGGDGSGGCSSSANVFNAGETCTTFNYGEAGWDGSYFWAQDIDACGSNSSTEAISIDLAVPATNNGLIQFTGLFADSPSASPGYDAADGALIEYSTNGGTSWTTGLNVIRESGNDLSINGTTLTTTFQKFSFSVGSGLGGSVVTIRVTFSGLASGAESLAIDDFCLEALCGIQLSCPVVECDGGNYKVTVPYSGSQAGLTLNNTSGSGTVTFDPTIVDGTIVISGISTGNNWSFNLANGCSDALSGSAISCSTPTCPPVIYPSGATVKITSCPANGVTQGGQDALADADASLETPYGTWRGAVERAAADGVLDIVFEQGHYMSDNTIAFAWGSPSALPASLAGLTVYGGNSVIEQAVGGTQVGFIQISGVNNVTINDLNFINFDNPSGSIASIIDASGIVFNNITVDGSDRSGDAFVITTATEDTEVSFYCSEFYNHFSHNPPNSVMTITGDGSTNGGSHSVTANFVDTEWRCNNRNGFGGALNVLGGDNSIAGPSVNFWGGIFSGNVANATDAGAIHVAGNSTIFIDGTDFECNSNTSNDGSGGGALFIEDDSNATILNANFSNNVSSLDGGAITFNGSGELRVEGCEFHNNIANGGAGGGIFYRGKNGVTTQTGTISNCYFSGNTDGIYFEGVGNLSPMNLDITSCTFTGNLGNGLSITSSDSDEDNVNLCNSVFCNNGGTDVFQNFEPANLSIDGTSIIGTGTYAQGSCSSIAASKGYLNSNPTALICGSCLVPSVSVASCPMIGNYVWTDTNGDGVQDSGEPAIGGLTVTLIDCAGDCSDTSTNTEYATTTTDAMGLYSFRVSVGTYQVVVSTPSGMAPTFEQDSNIDGIHEITVNLGDEYLIADFGFNQILPIELNSFYIENVDCNTILHWTTLSEKNASHFEIEKSIDGRLFQIVDKVEAKGSLFEEMSYSYNNNENKNAVLFRLKMVDLDGTFEYSNVISYDAENCEKYISIQQIYPSPTKNLLHIEIGIALDTEIEINIIDVTGRKVKNSKENMREGLNISNIDVSSLTNGIYYLQIISQVTGKSSNVKFIKM